MTNKVVLWDIATGRERLAVGLPGRRTCDIAISPDGKILVAATQDMPVDVWDALSGKQLFQLPTSYG